MRLVAAAVSQGVSEERLRGAPDGVQQHGCQPAPEDEGHEHSPRIAGTQMGVHENCSGQEQERHAGVRAVGHVRVGERQHGRLR